MSLLPLLSQAANAKTSSDAIDRLVSAWNLNPAKELEDAIVAIDGERPAFVGDFLKVAKKAPPSERGPLLASVTTAALSDVTRRLELLAQWSRDPRTSRMLLELLSGVPWSSDSSKPAWTAAFALMVKQADARFVAASKELPSKWKVRSTMRQWLERAFARAIERLEPIAATALSTQERAALTKAVTTHAKAKASRAGAKDEASLLQAIYATPADDGPRAVLADLLQERNDPRGEFIALQLANDARANKLLAANAKKWVGELAPVLTTELEFRRGFPAVGRTKFRHQADAEKFGGRPEWATFEELEWGTPTPIPRGQEPFCRFIGPVFRHLKIARGPYLPSLLAAKEPWALEALEVVVTGEKELVELGAKLPTLFPKLTKLFVRNVQGEWFRGVKHLDRLAELTTRGAPKSYGRGWEVLQSLPVGALVISTGESRWHFTRGSKGTFSKLTLHLADKENALRHEDYTRQLPTGFLESFELVTGKKPDAKAVPAIRRALELAQKRWAAGKRRRP